MLPTTPGRRQAALALLHAHRDAMVRERATRVHLITLARGYGLTNQEIGDALGMTEGGIRQTIRRSTGGR